MKTLKTPIYENLEFPILRKKFMRVTLPTATIQTYSN